MNLGELAQVITSIATLVAVVGGLVISLGNRKVSLETKAVAVEAKAVAEKTELNTNSMREALVASTAIASHAEGREEARKEGEDKAATLAEGIKQGAASNPAESRL